MPPLPSAHTTLVALACFLGATVYAFSLLFAAVIMPGLSALDDDAAYLRAFQVIDGTIQNNQPLFILSWVGSMLVAVALAVVTVTTKSIKTPLLGRTSMVLVCIVFLIGHVITVTKNIPRNNRLHALDIASADSETLASLRDEFNGPWSAWNSARAVLFGLATVLWLVALVYKESLLVDSHRQSFESPPEVEAQFNRVV